MAATIAAAEEMAAKVAEAEEMAAAVQQHKEARGQQLRQRRWQQQ